ncbi:MAG: hypothetical protein IMZ75_02035 [Actinobacteria bacterium]|nr:hypothetical protein [Actinomycetota bacterium]
MTRTPGRTKRQRFALEPREGNRVRRQRLGQDLDRDVATEFRVPRPIDLAHAARADGGDDLIRPEAGASS